MTFNIGETMKSISINIDEQVKDHFEQFIQKHGTHIDANDIHKAQEKIKTIHGDSKDTYVLHQITSLESMINMIEDDSWQTDDDTKQQINATIRYFVDDSDVIPDHIPGIGYVDDCIVIDNTMDAIENTLLEYMDFCRTRMVYANNEKFTMDDWNKIKDQEATSRARNRRYRKARKSRGW